MANGATHPAIHTSTLLFDRRVLLAQRGIMGPGETPVRMLGPNAQQAIFVRHQREKGPRQAPESKMSIVSTAVIVWRRFGLLFRRPA